MSTLQVFWPHRPLGQEVAKHAAWNVTVTCCTPGKGQNGTRPTGEHAEAAPSPLSSPETSCRQEGAWWNVRPGAMPTEGRSSISGHRRRNGMIFLCKRESWHRVAKAAVMVERGRSGYRRGKGSSNHHCNASGSKPQSELQRRWWSE